MLLLAPPAVTVDVFACLPDRFSKVQPTVRPNAHWGGHAIDSLSQTGSILAARIPAPGQPLFANH